MGGVNSSTVSPEIFVRIVEIKRDCDLQRLDGKSGDTTNANATALEAAVVSLEAVVAEDISLVSFLCSEESRAVEIIIHGLTRLQCPSDWTLASRVILFLEKLICAGDISNSADNLAYLACEELGLVQFFVEKLSSMRVKFLLGDDEHTKDHQHRGSVWNGFVAISSCLYRLSQHAENRSFMGSKDTCLVAEITTWLVKLSSSLSSKSSTSMGGTGSSSIIYTNFLHLLESLSQDEEVARDVLPSLDCDLLPFLLDIIASIHYNTTIGGDKGEEGRLGSFDVTTSCSSGLVSIESKIAALNILRNIAATSNDNRRLIVTTTSTTVDHPQQQQQQQQNFLFAALKQLLLVEHEQADSGVENKHRLKVAAVGLISNLLALSDLRHEWSQASFRVVDLLWTYITHSSATTGDKTGTTGTSSASATAATTDSAGTVATSTAAMEKEDEEEEEEEGGDIILTVGLRYASTALWRIALTMEDRVCVSVLPPSSTEQDHHQQQQQMSTTAAAAAGKVGEGEGGGVGLLTSLLSILTTATTDTATSSSSLKKLVSLQSLAILTENDSEIRQRLVSRNIRLPELLRDTFLLPYVDHRRTARDDRNKVEVGPTGDDAMFLVSSVLKILRNFCKERDWFPSLCKKIDLLPVLLCLLENEEEQEGQEEQGKAPSTRGGDNLVVLVHVLLVIGQMTCASAAMARVLKETQTQSRLLDILVAMAWDAGGPYDVRANAFWSLWNLSIAMKDTVQVAVKDDAAAAVGLLAALTKTLGISSDSPGVDVIMCSLSGLSLACECDDDENKQTLSSDEFGLLPLLPKLLLPEGTTSGSGGIIVGSNMEELLQLEVLKLLSKIVSAMSSHKKIGEVKKEESLLLSALVLCATSTNASSYREVRRHALSALLSFVETSENRSVFVTKAPNLVSFLWRILERNERGTSVLAAAILWNLATELKDSVKVAGGGLLEVMKGGTIGSKHEQSDHLSQLQLQSISLRGLIKAATVADNRVLLAAVDVGVLSFLLAFFADEFVRTASMAVVKQLAEDHTNKVTMISYSVGQPTLLSLLSKSLLLDNVSGVKNAFASDILFSLALAHENRAIIAGYQVQDSSQGHSQDSCQALLRILIQVIRSPNTHETKKNMFGVLWCIAMVSKNEHDVVTAADGRSIGLLDFLLSTVDDWKVRLASINALKQIILLSENDRPLMVSKDIGIVPFMVAIASFKGSIIRKINNNQSLLATTCALDSLQRLAKDSQSAVLMVANCNTLLPLLVDLTREVNGNSRDHVLLLLVGLALAYENQIMMASSELGLLQLLVDVFREPKKGKSRVNVLRALVRIAAASENKVVMGSSELGLLPLLVDVLREPEKGEARFMALDVLWNLSIAPENRVMMASSELGLLPLLVEVLREPEKGEARIKVLWTLARIATDNRVMLASSELGLLPLLVDVLREPEKGDAALHVCTMIRLLLLEEGVRTFMTVNSEFRLQQALIQAAGEEDSVVYPHVLSLIWLCSFLCQDVDTNWAALRRLSAIFCDKKLSMKKRMAAVSVINYLVRAPYVENGISTALTKEEGCVLSALAVVFDDTCESLVGMHSLICSVLWSWAEDGFEYPEIGEALIKQGAHIAALKYLFKVGPDRCSWSDKTARGTPSVCLTILMNLASCEAAVEPMKAAGALDLMSKILVIESNGCQSLKAMFVVAFLVGKDEESKSTSSLLHVRTDTIDNLLHVLDDILCLRSGEDYTFGDFCLRVVVQACLVMSISDSNKKILVKGPLSSLLLRVLDYYASDGKSLVDDTFVGDAGGGGNDLASARFAMETLMQLSFFYDDDKDLTSQLLTHDNKAEGILEKLMSKDKLETDALRNVSRLLVRIRGIGGRVRSVKTKSDPGSAASTSSVVNNAIPRSHIMISYCWNKVSKPENVKQLTTELRRLGYDIWRDEDGSSLVSPMSGATDEKMAEAIEKASVVVVCVSKPYKESVNCRLEAKYANQRMKKGKVKLVFLMMQQEYTTVSSEDSCDGWLGFMIGDALWYPLWEQSMIEGTVKQVANMVGELGKTAPATFLPPTLSQPTSFPSSKNSALLKQIPSKEQVPSTSAKSNAVPISDEGATVNSPRAAGAGVAAARSIRDVAQVDARIESILKDCWELLQNPARALHADQMASLIQEIGICEAGDLKYCDEQTEENLASQLKPLPRKKFKTLIAELKAISTS